MECGSDQVSFQVLRFVPRDKVVVLGLVSTTDPTLEDEDVLLRHIDQASAFLDVDQLALSPQCGFAPLADRGSSSESDQWRKLELVLRSGALPAPISPSNEQRIGPALGRDSIRLGVVGAIGGGVHRLLFRIS